MKKIERTIYFDASIEVIRRAAVLRKNTTEAEQILWSKINKNQINGLRFRRQHPIGKFIVDFYCHELLLVIELDGAIHNDIEVAERDAGREMELKKKGLKVVRFTNEQVKSDLNDVVDAIKNWIKK